MATRPRAQKNQQPESQPVLPGGASAEVFGGASTSEPAAHEEQMPPDETFLPSSSTLLGAANNVLASPVQVLGHDSGSEGLLKVDAVISFGGLLLIRGWSQRGVRYEVVHGSNPAPMYELRTPRPDVARHLKLESESDLGFVLWQQLTIADDVRLTWIAPDGTQLTSLPLVISNLGFDDSAELAPWLHDLAKVGSSMVPFSDAWLRLVPYLPLSTGTCSGAKGSLEGGGACSVTGDAIVFGWEVHDASTTVWLQYSDGAVQSLDSAYRRFRQDVSDVAGNEFPQAAFNSGFVCNVKSVQPGSVLRLKAQTISGIYGLGEIQLATMPVSPVAAARWLFGIWVPIQDARDRFSQLDRPVLERLMQASQVNWESLPVRSHCLGTGPRNPQVSVIVPLYGRLDFVEHQLIEFSGDPWFRANVQLIYVLDDPKLVDDFVNLAETLFRLYQVPFLWVWGSTNRGFSGANNLGVKFADAPNLLFLNSDAFPQNPGWVAPLIGILDKHADVGAVGPRLVFADGSIQHAGIEFRRRNELGIWINHHPHMGLAPELDPHDALTKVPAVTGACIAMRRADFDQIGGWDTGYLIGDFEDSDLCLKLRAAGKSIGYLPTVQLTHLERQSFKSLGHGDFRQRVVIYNAARHSERWSELLSCVFEPADEAGEPMVSTP